MKNKSQATGSFGLLSVIVSFPSPTSLFPFHSYDAPAPAFCSLYTTSILGSKVFQYDQSGHRSRLLISSNTYAAGALITSLLVSSNLRGNTKPISNNTTIRPTTKSNIFLTIKLGIG